MKTNTFNGLLIGSAIAIISIFSACQKDSQSSSPSGCDCQTETSCRRGAMCNDGSSSSSTGSGACSGHGGVDYWLCR